MINNDDDLNVIEFFANQSPNHVIDGSSILFCFFLVNEISKSNSPEYLQNILQWNKERKQVGWRIQNPQTKNTQHSNWKKFFFQFEKKIFKCGWLCDVWTLNKKKYEYIKWKLNFLFRFVYLHRIWSRSLTKQT